MGARVTSRKRGSITETVVYWRDLHGKRHVRFFGTDKGKAEEFRREIDGPLPTEAHSPTLTAWTKRWIERLDVLVKAGRLRPPTLKNYVRVSGHWNGHWLGSRSLEELHRRDVKAWVQELLKSGLAPTTVRLYVACLRACLSEAIEEGFLRPPNPSGGLIRAMRLPALSDPPEAPPVDATALILASVQGSSAVPVAVILYLGLRLGEALGLQWSDVDLESGTVNVCRQVYDDGSVVGLKTKAGKRTVAVPSPLIDVLRSQRLEQKERALASGEPSTEWVLGVSPEKANAARQRWGRHLKQAAKAAGYKGRTWIHGLRHTHAIGRLEEGGDLDALKRGMGHSTIKLTSDLYGAHAQKLDREAADRFGEKVRGGQLGLFRKK